MIDIQNVSKSFPGQDILIDASLKINQGEHVGIIGPNGTGKTTLFSLIIKEVSPDKGEVVIPVNNRISYLKQQLSTESYSKTLIDYTEDAIPELSLIDSEIRMLEKKLHNSSDKKTLDRLGVLQIKFEALGGYNLRNKAESALTGLGFSKKDFSRNFSEFSGGWQMRAALARVLIADADILLLDEPSNYLDINSIEWLYRYLKDYQGTMVLISHDRFLLNKITKITVELNNCKMTRYEGNYDYYVKERESRAASSDAWIENQQKKREQIESFINRFRYKSSKASQVQSRVKMLEKMEDIKAVENISYSGSLRLPPPPKSSHEVVRLEECSFSYDKINWIFKDFSISVNREDKIAIVGYNGMGKTTLLKVLSGSLEPTNGRRIISSSTVIGYQAQEFAEILHPESTVYDIVRSNAKDIGNIRAVLGSFGFSSDSVEKPCKVLSGGEKIRLLFARIFINPPNLLILDEPTTHLDIQARENLQQVLRDYKGTVCLVSHDIEFIRNTATTIYALTDSGIKKYFGNYDYYLQKKDEVIDNRIIGEKSGNLKNDDRKAKRKQNAEIRNKFYKERKKLEKIIENAELELEQSENKKNELVLQLNSVDKSVDYNELNRSFLDIEDKIKHLTYEWESKSIELENLQNKINELID